MHKKTILLVEDTQDDVELMLLALRKNQCSADVVVMPNGTEALRYLMPLQSDNTNPVPPIPTLMLLDLNMPGCNGFEVLQQVRRELPDHYLPIIVTTSSPRPEDVERCYALGATGYIRKAVDFNQFVTDVRCVTDYWLELNVSPTRRQSSEATSS